MIPQSDIPVSICPDASGHYWTVSGQDRVTAAHVKRNEVWQTMKCVSAVTSRQCHESLNPARWPNSTVVYNVYTFQANLLLTGWHHMTQKHTKHYITVWYKQDVHLSVILTISGVGCETRMWLHNSIEVVHGRLNVDHCFHVSTTQSFVSFSLNQTMFANMNNGTFHHFFTVSFWAQNSPFHWKSFPPPVHWKSFPPPVPP